MSKVVVIGGGAAGMFASIAAAGCGHQVVVYERMKSLERTLYHGKRQMQYYQCL